MPRKITVFLLVIIASCFLLNSFSHPLYIDDAHWPIQNGRVLYDGLKMINLYPQCVSNFTWDVPWTLVPGRVFVSLIHPDTVLGLRINGIIKFLMVTALLTFIGGHILRKKLEYLYISAFFIGLFSLGFLPVLMVFNRPESAIFIGCALVFSINIYFDQSPRPPAQKLLGCVFFMLIVSWMTALHPKVIFLSPFLLLTAICTKIESKSLKAILIGFIILSTYSSYDLWKNQSVCPDSNRVVKYLESHSVLPTNVFASPKSTLSIVMSNIKQIPNRYLEPFSFSDKYIGYREGYKNLNKIPAFIEKPIGYLSTTTFIFLFISSIGFLTYSFAKRTAWITREQAFKNLLSASLFLPIIFVMLTRKTDSVVKELPMIVPSLCLSILILVGINNKILRHVEKSKKIIICFVFFSTIAQITFFYKWKDITKTGSTDTDQTLGLFYDDIFQRISSARERNEKIIQHANKCGIGTDSSFRHLVLDDWTYMPFKNTFQPFYGRYLFTFGSGKSGLSFEDFLSSRESDGVITMCRTLPKSLKYIAHRDNELCCIRKEQLNRN